MQLQLVQEERLRKLATRKPWIRMSPCYFWARSGTDLFGRASWKVVGTRKGGHFAGKALFDLIEVETKGDYKN